MSVFDTSAIRIVIATCIPALLTLCNAVAAKPEPFDLAAPPLPEPGKSYQLILHPGKGTPPISLIFVAGTETFGQEGEKKYSNIQSLIQVGHGQLPIESHGGVPNMDVADYDNDGFLDFRIIAGWGSGGSWYNYYRFDGTKYILWEEPMKLGISQIEPEKALASAAGRSGPSWAVSRYHMIGHHFFLFEKEIYDKAQYRRPLVPKEVPDGHYALITETIRDNKIIHRKIVEMNPWEDERMQKIILDSPVDETIPKPEDQK